MGEFINKWWVDGVNSSGSYVMITFKSFWFEKKLFYNNSKIKRDHFIQRWLVFIRNQQSNFSK